jgi:hypothetical protein
MYGKMRRAKLSPTPPTEVSYGANCRVQYLYHSTEKLYEPESQNIRLLEMIVSGFRNHGFLHGKNVTVFGATEGELGRRECTT